MPQTGKSPDAHDLHWLTLSMVQHTLQEPQQDYHNLSTSLLVLD